MGMLYFSWACKMIALISKCFIYLISFAEEWDEDEWEWEEEEEEEPEIAKDEEGKAQITITENLVTIDRSKVDWSDDEFEEDDSPTGVPPPPPAPPAPPAPPPPPPGMPGTRSTKTKNSIK